MHWAHAQKSMLRPSTRTCLSLSLSLPMSLFLSVCVRMYVCVHGYFLFCINAPQASLSRQLACHRLPAPVSSAGRSARQHAVSCPTPSPTTISVAPYSCATAAAAADVNLLKKFRFLAFFCILADGLSLYCAGGNRFHFMLSIEFKLFGK